MIIGDFVLSALVTVTVCQRLSLSLPLSPLLPNAIHFYSNRKQYNSNWCINGGGIGSEPFVKRSSGPVQRPSRTIMHYAEGFFFLVCLLQQQHIKKLGGLRSNEASFSDYASHYCGAQFLSSPGAGHCHEHGKCIHK